MRLKKLIIAWGTREKDVRQMKKCFENELAIKREKGKAEKSEKQEPKVVDNWGTTERKGKRLK